MKTLGVILLLGLLSAAILAFDFSGTYTATVEGVAYTMTLKDDGKGGLTGTLVEGEDRYKVNGTVTGNTAKGTCSDADGEALEFKLERSGANLILTLYETDEGVTVELGRITFSSVNATPAMPAGPAKKTAATATPKPAIPKLASTGGSHRFLWGTSLNLAKGWAVKMSGGEPFLVPPGMKSVERYFAPVVAVPEPMWAKDEAFSQALCEYVAPATAGMQVVSDKVVETKAGPGRVIAFEGSGRRLHIYAAIQDGLGVGILASGPKADILARASDLSSMFASMDKGKGQFDPALVGTWSYSSNKGNTDLNSYNRSARRTIAQLAPDGTYAMQTNSKTVLSGDGFHAEAGSTGAVFRGRWFAGKGVLVIVSDSGDPEFLTYSLSGDSITIADREGQRETFVRGG